ncbi:MAG TPA: PRC-barrel domain-containing protein [Chryseosolibacter sp.]|nr:PRC-barrel domain-containing protein [Chryseosolibacter sp.]
MAMQEKDYRIDNQTGVNREGALANTPVQRLSASSIMSDKIEDPRGEELGHIDNLMINIHTGTVEYAVVEFGAFLGIGGKLFAIPFGELRPDPVKQVFVLNRDKEYLKDSPGFDKNHWPDTNDHTYFDNVGMYYGSYVPPFP